MPDVREQILARLIEVARSVPDIKTALRNSGGLSEGRRPAVIVYDADEMVEDMEAGGRRPSHAPNLVMMTPEILVMASNRAADIGAELNVFRRRMIRRILTDEPLRALVGANGDIRYAGCVTALASGRTMEGEMALSFAFTYALKPSELED